MKPLAEWIRNWTPEWTDETRHAYISQVHKLLQPACLIGFIFVENVIVRWLAVFWIFQTAITQLTLRRCAIRWVERRFSKKPYVDVVSEIFRIVGWNVSRSERMTYHIGMNLGTLLIFALILLKENVLWMVGLAGVTVTALPTLVLFSKALHPPDIAELPLPNIHLL